VETWEASAVGATLATARVGTAATRAEAVMAEASPVVAWREAAVAAVDAEGRWAAGTAGAVGAGAKAAAAAVEGRA
jgi:hypothetical protein